MKRTVCKILIASLIMLVFAGCAAPAAAPVEEKPAEVAPTAPVVEPTAEPKVLKVGLVPPALVSPFYIVLCDTAKALAAENKYIDLTVQAPSVQTAIEEQIKIVEDMIQKKVDVIALATGNWDALAPVLIQAREAGIEVIMVDRVVPVEGLDAVSMLGSDEIEGGKIMGDFIVKTLNGKGKVAILAGVAGTYHSERRQQGFREAIANEPGIEVVTIQPANMQRELAMTTMENIIQSQPELDLVWGLNDNMAMGALTAIQAANKQDQIIVVGFNGDKEALGYVKDGTMLATCKSQPAEIARSIVEEILPLLIAGKRSEVKPAYPIHVVLTTKENVDQFIVP